MREAFVAYLSSQSWPRRWRARSRACAAVDMVLVAAGGALCAVTVVDVLSTWHTSRAIVDHDHLLQIVGAVLFPGWIWLLASMLLTVPVLGLDYGLRRSHDLLRSTEVVARRAQARLVTRTMYAGGLVARVLVSLGVLCVCAIVVGFALGAAKGSGHILPGPRYEISTWGLNKGAWTAVSANQYAWWQARFVRLDALFTLFGLAMVGGGLGLLQLHRTAAVRIPAEQAKP